MKKALKKTMTAILALAVLLTFTACGNDSSGNASNVPAPTPVPSESVAPEASELKDWTGFHDWLDEDWEDKTPVYQFTGSWALAGEQNIAYSFLMNLYSDGSILADQYQPGRYEYQYFGSWDLAEDPDGDELTINIVEETNEDGDLIDHCYQYTVYEQEDGSFTFSYDFGIAAGQYFRTVSLSGSKEMTYVSLADFLEAADNNAIAADENGTEPEVDPRG